MESKRAYLDDACLENALLIEPVWNRNYNEAHLKERLSKSFNRTSMESKLVRTMEVVNDDELDF